MRKALIIGASGDVGSAAARRLLDQGYRIVALSRDAAKLASLRDRHGPEAVQVVEGGVDTEEKAARVAAEVEARAGKVDAVIASIQSPPAERRPLTQWSADELAEIIRTNLLAHFIAAKTFIPRLAPGGVYVSLGGGMADRVVPNMGYNSMIQAAERMMIRHLDSEHRSTGVFVRELIIAAMVSTARRRGDDPNFNWVADHEVAEQLQAIIERPENFEDPVVVLRPTKPAHAA